MSIIDGIKKSVLEQFNASLGAKDIILSLLVAAILSVLIIVIYRKTFAGIVYSRSTSLTIIMITLTTALIIRTINSNLSLSLGMVGALSIVRFRTAIKDSIDTAFIFWAVTAGIMSGAGLYFLAVLGSVGIALIYYIAYLTSVKTKKKYLLMISYSDAQSAYVSEILGKLSRKDLKSKSMNNGKVEESYLVNPGAELDKIMDELKAYCRLNLVAYSNDYGM